MNDEYLQTELPGSADESNSYWPLRGRFARCRCAEQAPEPHFYHIRNHALT